MTSQPPTIPSSTAVSCAPTPSNGLDQTYLHCLPCNHIQFKFTRLPHLPPRGRPQTCENCARQHVRAAPRNARFYFVTARYICWACDLSMGPNLDGIPPQTCQAPKDRKIWNDLVDDNGDPWEAEPSFVMCGYPRDSACRLRWTVFGSGWVDGHTRRRRVVFYGDAHAGEGPLVGREVERTCWGEEARLG